MARDFVKDLNSVEKFNQELDKSKNTLDALKGVDQDLGVTLLTVAEATEKSGNYSKENLNIAKQQTTIGRDVLRVLNNQNKSSKLGTIAAKAKLNLTRLFSNKSDEITQQLFEQYDLQQETTKEQKKQTNFVSNITNALKQQLPFGREISEIFGKNTDKFTKLGAVIGITTTLLKSFSKITKVIGDEFGALGMKNEQFKQGIFDATVTARQLGMDTKDVVDVIKELTTNFGFSRDEALGLSNQIIDTSRAIGVSNQEGVRLLGSLTVTVEEASTWEIQEGLQFPHFIKAQCEFKHIGKYVPASTSKHYDLNWLKANGLSENRYGTGDLGFNEYPDRSKEYRDSLYKNLGQKIGT